MGHPILQNTWRLSIYTAVFLLSGLLYAIAVYPLLKIPIELLLVDGLLTAVLYGLFTIPLWVVVKYAHYANDQLYKRLWTYAAFCLLLLVFWLAIVSWFNYHLFSYDVFFALVTKTSALKALLGIAIYINLVLVYVNLYREEESKEDEIEEQQEIIAEPKEETNSISSLATNVEILERVSVKLGKKIHLISIPDINYLQSEGDYVMIFCNDGHYLKEQTMKYFEEHLPTNKFVRIHRSCIVNVEIISRVELYEKQHYLVTLQNGQQLKASLAGYKLLRKTLSL